MSWLREFLRRFRDNQRGIIWVWAVVLMALVVYSIGWFTLGWATMEVIDAVESSYTFQSPASQTVTLIRNVIAWHPLIVIFGWLLYGYVNSQRRDPRIYED